ncbi:MAG TPA: HAD family phosphatase [Flavobacterium sp.]|jgi:putative hydrolase of the HAD superfamily
MINTIIFDFGDVFLNLQTHATVAEFKKLGLDWPNETLLKLNAHFEKGEISELEFIEGFQKFIPHAGIEDIRYAWNALIGDFPLYRLEFLQMLSLKYRLFLLTNTDAIHISRFEHSVGMSFSGDFYRCFEKVYYSFEMGMRKPEPEIFSYIIRNHELTPAKTLFIDDKMENIRAAESVGLQVWHLQVGAEDVVDLYDKKIL